MKWSYDANVGALYVRVSDLPIDHQVEEHDIICDVAAGGELVGLELLSSSCVADLVAFIPERFGLDEDTTGQIVKLIASGVMDVRLDNGGTVTSSRSGVERVMKTLAVA